MKITYISSMFSLALAVAALPNPNAANANPTKCGTGSKNCPSTSSVSSSSPSSTSVLAHYDDLTFNPAVPVANILTTYKGLLYNSFSGSNKSAATNGVMPDTFPNYVTSSIKQQTVSGIPYVSTKYAGSLFTSFTPISIAIGCVAMTTTSLITAPLQCTITVNGYRNSTLVASTTFTYTPPVGSTTMTPTQSVSFPPGFSNINNLTFQEDNPALKVELLDSFAYLLFF